MRQKGVSRSSPQNPQKKIHRTHREQPVVEQRAVVEVLGGEVGGGGGQEAAQHALHLGGPLEEELHGGREEGELHCRRLQLAVGVDQRLEDVGRLGELLVWTVRRMEGGEAARHVRRSAVSGA